MPQHANRNLFTPIRICLAMMVMVSHSFTIADRYYSDIFWRLTKSMDLGALAVKCFFAVSGFLVFQSALRSTDIWQYLSKRILRIYPALFPVIVLLMVVAAHFYQGSGSVTALAEWRALPWDVLGLFHQDLVIPHVFADHAEPQLNAPLWTLPYEFLCYLLVGVLAFALPRRYLKAAISSAVLILTFTLALRYNLFNDSFFKKINMVSYYFYDMSLYFFVGAMAASAGLLPPGRRSWLIILGAAMVFALSFMFRPLLLLRYFALPICILTLAQQPVKSQWIHRLPDISYGIYIYGWVVQQCIYDIWRPSPWVITATALPITMILAYFSWTFVEKPALALKKWL